MKRIFTVVIGLLLLSTPAFACLNLIDKDKAEIAVVTGPASTEVSCHSNDCYCADGISWEYAELVDNEVLDYISKLNEVSCESQEDCDNKFQTSSCLEGYEKIKNYDQLEVYCVKDVMKIDGKKLVNSTSKKATYDAAQATKAQLEGAMKIARKSQQCGNDTLAYMLVRNASKGLSNAQKKALVKGYTTITALLQLGSLDSAKEEINSATADGVLVTESDKVALAAYIDGCKP